VTFKKEDYVILDGKDNVVVKGQQRSGVYQFENFENAMIAMTEG